MRRQENLASGLTNVTEDASRFFSVDDKMRLFFVLLVTTHTHTHTHTHFWGIGGGGRLKAFLWSSMYRGGLASSHIKEMRSSTVLFLGAL